MRIRWHNQLPPPLRERRSPPERLFHCFPVSSRGTEPQAEEVGGVPPAAITAVHRLFQNAESGGRAEVVLQRGAYRECAIACAVGRPAGRRPQPGRPGGRVIELVRRVLPWLAIVMAEQQDPDAVGVIARQQVTDEDEVAERLAHLLALVTEHADVHPDASERPHPRRGLRLRDLAVVVRIDQIGAAAMDIDLWAQMLQRHRRALDMPARPAHAPGTLPVWFARGAYLPEHQIERVLLARVLRICTSLRRERDHLLAAQPAQATVIGDTSDAEIDVALALVGMALRF